MLRLPATAVALLLLLPGGPAPCQEARGRTGVRTLVTAARVPERHDADFLAGLAADLELRWEAAREAYARSRRMGRCAAASRCHWHDRLDEELLRERHGLRVLPGDANAHANYAITCANKLIALSLDAGQRPAALFAKAEKHYLVARDMAPPSGRNDVLLGLAALYGEAGQEDRARGLFARIDVAQMESSTSFGNLAYFLTTIGETEQAFVMLERALSLDDASGRYRRWVIESDDYHRVRHHPRFEEILARY